MSYGDERDGDSGPTNCRYGVDTGPEGSKECNEMEDDRPKKIVGDNAGDVVLIKLDQVRF
jgi:hypothetical protein